MAVLIKALIENNLGNWYVDYVRVWEFDESKKRTKFNDRRKFKRRKIHERIQNMTKK